MLSFKLPTIRFRRLLGAGLALLIAIVAAEAEPLIVPVASARAEIREAGRPSLHITLNREGQRLFGDFTTRNVGRNIEVRFNGRVLTRIRLRTPILGNELRIGEALSFEEAKALAAELSLGDQKLEVEALMQAPTLFHVGKAIAWSAWHLVTLDG